MNVAPRKPSIEGLAPAFTPQRSVEAPAINLDLRRSLHMHPVLAAVVTLVVAAVMLAYSVFQPRLYKASSRIYVQPTVTRALSEASSSYDSARYDSYMQQQIQTLARPDILEAAVDALPIGVWRHRGESVEAAADRLGAALKVERIDTTYELNVSLSGLNARDVAATVNAVVSAYLREGRKDELAQSDQQAQVLNEEHGRILKALDDARQEQSALSASLGTARPGVDNTNPYDAGLTGLRVDLAAAREAHDLAAAQLASLDGSARSAGLTAASEEAITTDAGLNSMKATINERRGKLSSEMAGLTPNNPVYKQDQAEIAQMDRSLEQMTEGLRTKAATHLQDKLRLEIARTNDLEARLNGELARQAASATSAAPKLQRAADLTAEVQRLHVRLATVEDTLRGLQLEANSPGTAHLSVAATVPLAPQTGRARLIKLAALPVGLILGLLTAVAWKRFDNHLYIASDVEQVVGFLPLAVLPSGKDVSAAVEEEYMLRLAAGVEHALRSSNARTFVITAISSADQISGLVTDLREKLGRMGVRARVVRPAELLEPQSASREGSRGSGLMRNDASASTHSRHESYAITNLHQMTREYDILMIEAAPLLISAQTEYISRSADATILVATSGITRRDDLLQAASLLQRVNARGVGTILKEMRLRYADNAYKRTIAALKELPTAPDSADGKVSTMPGGPFRAFESTHSMEAEIVEEPLPDVDQAQQQEKSGGDRQTLQSTAINSSRRPVRSFRSEREEEASPSKAAEETVDPLQKSSVAS